MKTQSLKEYLAERGITNPFLSEHWHLKKRRYTTDKQWEKVIKELTIKQRSEYKIYDMYKKSYYRLVDEWIIREHTRDEELQIASNSMDKIKSEAAKRILKKRLEHKKNLWE